MKIGIYLLASVALTSFLSSQVSVQAAEKGLQARAIIARVIEILPTNF